GVVCTAGVDVSNPQLVDAVNYFGTVELMEGLRPALAAAPYAAAVLNISNSIHITPNVPLEPVEALMAGETADAEAMLGDREHVAYQVSKMAVARWLRRNAPSAAWAGAGIRCNGIGPGPVMTELLEQGLSDPEKSKQINSLPLPLGEFSTPEGVADVVAFLLSADARYLVGQILYIDGGLESLLRGNDVPLPWKR
ncbi:MAG: SDR family oxidoreductase, partial [Caldilineaceae bacterium]